MVASIRVPKTQRARRELLKHAPKLVSFLLYPSSHPHSLNKTILRRARVERHPSGGPLAAAHKRIYDCKMSDRAGVLHQIRAPAPTIPIPKEPAD
jgi:hypothetical protein